MFATFLKFLYYLFFIKNMCHIMVKLSFYIKILTKFGYPRSLRVTVHKQQLKKHTRSWPFRSARTVFFITSMEGFWWLKDSTPLSVLR